MRSVCSLAVLAFTAVLLAGCGSTMRDMLDRDAPPAQQAAVRQDLTMPPDLQLAPPGTAPAPVESYAVEGANDAMAPAVPAARPDPADDIYAQAGISKIRADGTPKSDEELRNELRQYYVAKKQQKNPKYGTVFNIGNIFSDE